MKWPPVSESMLTICTRDENHFSSASTARMAACAADRVLRKHRNLPSSPSLCSTDTPRTLHLSLTTASLPRRGEGRRGEGKTDENFTIILYNIQIQSRCASPCCLFDLACFFLYSFSHLSLKHVYIHVHVYMYIYNCIHVHVHVCTCTNSRSSRRSQAQCRYNLYSACTVYSHVHMIDVIDVYFLSCTCTMNINMYTCVYLVLTKPSRNPYKCSETELRMLG